MFDPDLELTNKDLAKIRTGIRKAFGHSKYRKDFLLSKVVKIDRFKKDGTKYKVPYSKYLCVDCNDHFDVASVDVDHIDEVGYFYSFKYVDVFLRRVYCRWDNLQILCKTCHKVKTKMASIKGYKLL